MRILGVIAASFALLLSGCGLFGSNYQAFFTGRSPEEVASQIQKVHGYVSFEGLLNPPKVERSRPDAGTVLFTIKGRNGGEDANIRFTMERQENGTRVYLDADIPHIEAEIRGRRKVLSADLVERALFAGLQNLSQAMHNRQSTDSAIKSLNEALAFTALATDPNEVKRALALIEDPAALLEAAGREAAWNSDNTSDWASADAAMDQTGGDDANGYEALGEDPAPDEEWGAASEY